MTQPGRHILLVDDEPSVVKMVGKRLEIAGFHVTVAMDGQAALDHVQAHPPDLIILDLMLPTLNGYEVCTMLKQDPRHRRIPIIIFTAKAQEDDRQKGFRCGADAYLTKPFKAELLIERIEALLQPPPSSESHPPADRRDT